MTVSRYCHRCGSVTAQNAERNRFTCTVCGAAVDTTEGLHIQEGHEMPTNTVFKPAPPSLDEHIRAILDERIAEQVMKLVAQSVRAEIELLLSRVVELYPKAN